MKISEKINKLLKEKDMTQQELADAIGVKQSTVSLWARGKTEPGGEVVKKIFEVLWQKKKNFT